MRKFIFIYIAVTHFLYPAMGQKKVEIYKVVEDMPRFPGCEEIIGGKEKVKKCAEDKLVDYIYSNLIYPVKAKENRIEGKCYLQFIVTENGDIEDVEIVRDIGYGCGEAAKAVVENMRNLPQKWVPGKQRAVPVNVLFTLPIKFSLENDDKSREFDEGLKESRIVVINNTSNNGHQGKFHIYYNERRLSKMGTNDYEAYNIKSGSHKLYISSSKYNTDSYDLNLRISDGQIAYLIIEKDSTNSGQEQYYNLIEIPSERAKKEIRNIENKRR